MSFGWCTVAEQLTDTVGGSAAVADLGDLV